MTFADTRKKLTTRQSDMLIVLGVLSGEHGPRTCREVYEFFFDEYHSNPSDWSWRDYSFETINAVFKSLRELGLTDRTLADRPGLPNRWFLTDFGAAYLDWNPTSA